MVHTPLINIVHAAGAFQVPVVSDILNSAYENLAQNRVREGIMELSRISGIHNTILHLKRWKDDLVQPFSMQLFFLGVLESPSHATVS